MEDIHLFPGEAGSLPGLRIKSERAKQGRELFFERLIKMSPSQTTVQCLLCNNFPTHCFLFLHTGILLHFKGRGNVSWFFGTTAPSLTDSVFSNSVILWFTSTFFTTQVYRTKNFHYSIASFHKQTAPQDSLWHTHFTSSYSPSEL